MTSILIIMNNYFHDVATAFLLASAVVVWMLGKAAERGSEHDRDAFARALPSLTRMARVAIVWIILGGIPRTIFFTRYEWDPAVIKGIVPALAIKHVLMFTAVVVGAVVWRRIARGVTAPAIATSEPEAVEHPLEASAR